MRKFKISIIVFLCMMLVSACNISETNIDKRLKAPKNNVSPLEGKWNVTDYVPVSDSAIKEEDEYMGQPALFHRDALIFMNYYTVKPSFKMKKVNSVDYFLYKYKINVSKLGIDNKDIEVLTIYNDNQFFMEAIKDGDKKLFLYMEDGFYKLEKMLDKVSIKEVNKYIDIEEKVNNNLNVNENESQESGVLLGIKSSNFDEENNIPDWTYSTIWINTKDKKIQEVYKIDDLLLPRKNGFWEIDVNRTIEKGNIFDKINASPQIYLDDNISKTNILNADKANRNKGINIQKGSTLKNILYVGNNYISTENIVIKNKNRKTIKIQIIDNLENENSINLTDIIDDGKQMFLEGAQGLLNIDESVSIDEKNIGLTRKNGYWMIKGRVNYEKNKEELYKDFIIKAVPPDEMIGYDNHFILWDQLKRKVPNMIDMYSSPNEDIIIIRNQFELLIFDSDSIKDVNSYPLATIELSENDSIVMAEWATKKYTEIWRNEILKKDIQKIEW